VTGQISGDALICGAFAVGEGCAPPPPPPPPPPAVGAKVPVASIDCSKLDNESVAKVVLLPAGDVAGVDGTDAEDILLGAGVFGVEMGDIDAREEAGVEGGVSEGVVKGSVTVPEDRCSGSGEDGEERGGKDTGGVEDPGDDGDGMEEAGGGFVDKDGVDIMRIGGIGGKGTELEDIEVLADETEGFEADGELGVELDPEDPGVVPPELLGEEADIENELRDDDDMGGSGGIIGTELDELLVGMLVLGEELVVTAELLDRVGVEVLQMEFEEKDVTQSTRCCLRPNLPMTSIVVQEVIVLIQGSKLMELEALGGGVVIGLELLDGRVVGGSEVLDEDVDEIPQLGVE
jgi:hypothetical protein